MRMNLVAATDSYKVSHHMQYPDNTTYMFSYMESRGGKHGHVTFFGLQYLLLEYLSKRVTERDVEEMYHLCADHFGTKEYFPYDGWMKIVDQYEGYLPLIIRALPEGSVVPVGTALFSIETVDPELFWLASWFEGLLQKVWYPTTVATEDFFTKLAMYEYLKKTSDNPDGVIPFALHDFGYRGASSEESSAWGGSAALVNFKGSDTIPALRLLREFYGEPCAGVSIAASEHSTVTLLGPEGEAAQMERMIQKFGDGPIFACVSDSYDLWNAIENIWGGSLREQVQNMNAMLVVRPDSGDPLEVVPKCLMKLEAAFGSTRNSKGYSVLNNVRVIQGDGIDHDGAIPAILERVTRLGFSAENVAFGMGGGRLQKVNRDTQKFAIKCSQAIVNGTLREVYKDPITDPGKVSKRGHVDTVRLEDGSFASVEGLGRQPDSAMQTVYDMGKAVNCTTLQEVRHIAENAFRKFANS